jgi:exopolyphosphatase/guanosine-5'-triphosphate,3'-diphosphate pyrophosphatase
LLGSSGAFDTFAEMTLENETVKYSKDEKTHEINVEKYFEAHELLVKSTLEERLQIKNIEPMRVEMIVLASILVNYLIKKLNLNRIIQSNYSMKEGIVFTHLSKCL